jgi:hypothetical protein
VRHSPYMDSSEKPPESRAQTPFALGGVLKRLSRLAETNRGTARMSSRESQEGWWVPR